MNSASTFFEAEVVGQAHDLTYQRARQAAPAVLRMDQDAEAADVPLPAAKLLVERGVADDLAVHQCQHGEVAPQVNVLAPVANHLQFGHAVFDEHAFGFGHALEE